MKHPLTLYSIHYRRCDQKRGGKAKVLKKIHACNYPTVAHPRYSGSILLQNDHKHNCNEKALDIERLVFPLPIVLLLPISLDL